MEKTWELIVGFFNVGILILCVIGYFIFQCFYVWWFFNKWICIGIILLICLTLWLGVIHG